MSAQTVYLICIAAGILLLFFSILFSAVGDFIDLELPGLDIGDFDIDVLPISMKSLCLAVTVFGSVSLLMIDQDAVTRHAAAGVCAYAGAFLVQNFTGFLKNNQSEADSMESICSRHFVVNVSIPEHGYGSVASDEKGCSVITLTAKSHNGDAITAGTPVSVLDIVDNVAVVITR